MIRIDLDGLRDKKARIDQLRESLNGTLSELTSVMQSLPESWEGQAADAYAQQWDELRNGALNQTEEMLEGVSTQISQVCDNAESFDNDIANQINQ